MEVRRGSSCLVGVKGLRMGVGRYEAGPGICDLGPTLGLSGSEVGP